MKYISRPSIFLLFSISVISLFFGFNKNIWQAAEKNWYDTHELDMESYIAGRLVKSRQDGVFSAGGLTGLGSLTSVPVDYCDTPFGHQYETYVNGQSFGAYTSYNSQIGAQGISFSILDVLLDHFSNADGQDKLALFHIITSLFATATLSYIILWFHLEFGWKASILVLFSTLFSPWLVVFGRNLWWVLGFFYLPVCVTLYYLRHTGNSRNVSLIKLAGITCIAVFIKCLFNGYEYITTTLIMMVVPLIYYSSLYSFQIRRTLKMLGAMVLGSVLAIFLSFVILCFQIASVKGHFSDGIHHIVYSLGKRTYGNPTAFPDLPGLEQEGLKAELVPVLTTYLTGTFLDVSIPLASIGFRSDGALPIRYWHLILAFGIASAYIWRRRKHPLHQDNERQYVALIYATWFSILAPLSWFIIFKAHSFVHPHMNFLVWHMPFALFGFAVTGIAVRNLTHDLIPLKTKSLAALANRMPSRAISNITIHPPDFGRNEIVISLPLRESQAPYQNLHIIWCVIINPIRQNLSSESEVSALVYRLQPRISSAVAIAIQEQGPQTLSGINHLRTIVLSEAGIVLANALNDRPDLSNYTIQAIVTSIYWTDLSTGKGN